MMPAPAAAADAAAAAAAAAVDAAAASTVVAPPVEVAEAPQQAARKPLAAARSEAPGPPGGKQKPAAAEQPRPAAPQEVDPPPPPPSQPPLAQPSEASTAAYEVRMRRLAASVALPAPHQRFPGDFARAVVLLDYRDSELLHVLEDSVRQHNAMALGHAPPPDAELAAAAAAAAAAEAEAAAAAAAAAGAAGVARQGAKGSRPGSCVKPGAAGAAASGRQAPAVLSKGGVGAAAAASSINEGRRPSAAGSVAAAATATTSVGPAATPRSALKQPSPGSRRPSTTAATAATRLTTESGGQLQRRASFAAGSALQPEASGAASDDQQQQQPLGEADVQLQAALARYQHLLLEPRLLLVLSTQQLSAEQAEDAQLDVITGFQLVDGALRMFVLEGPADRPGMSQLVPAIARWAAEDEQEQEQMASGASPSQQPQLLRRRVLLSPLIKHPARLFGSLPADIWMLKLRASLSALAGDKGSCLTGAMRPECTSGLATLYAITQGYSSSCAPPSCSQLQAAAAGSASTSPRRHGCHSACSTAAAAIAAAAEAAAAGAHGQAAAGAPLSMRQLDEYRLFPSVQQLHAIDRRFGGELTEADVLGVDLDTDESGSSEDEGGPAGGNAVHPAAAAGGGGPGTSSSLPQRERQQEQLGGSHAAAVAAQAASAKLRMLLADAQPGASGVAAASEHSGQVSSCRSRSRHSRRSRKSGGGASGAGGSSRRRRHGLPTKRPTLDASNAAYVQLRLDAHRRRGERDRAAEHAAALAELAASRAPLREAWAAWNPQRAAARELLQQQADGGGAGQATVEGEQQQQQGHAHTSPDARPPVMWPAPRDPSEYARHALKPSQARSEELQQPWEEPGSSSSACGLTAVDHHDPPFDPLVRPLGDGLFTRDAAFWTSVHSARDGWEAQQAEEAAAAKAAWAARLVVSDPIFHVARGTCGKGDKAAVQADRLANLLKDAPVKKGLRLSHAPPPPVSMHASLPWCPGQLAASGTAAATVTAAAAAQERARWVAPQNFNALGAKTRSAVSRPGWSDAVTAALHDDD